LSYKPQPAKETCDPVCSLAQLNHVIDADGFRRFIERSAADSADQLQVL
jgi:hypothetical protein